MLPLDEERINEARIVIPFWQKAINDPDKAAIHRESMEQWRVRSGATWPRRGRPAKSTPRHRRRDLAGQLLSMLLLGAQITAALLPEHHSPEQLTDHLDSWLRMVPADS